MRLADKLRHLRFVEGNHRGLGRSMTKAEVVRAMRSELGEGISHPYLCQLEGGSRVHMTAGTRELLARFFKVLPGYLVDDPEGFEETPRTELPAGPERLRSWFAVQAEELSDEPFLAHVMFKLSRAEDPGRYVELLDRLLELSPPELDRVAETIRRREGAT
jgi:hypothetical protein